MTIHSEKSVLGRLLFLCLARDCETTVRSFVSYLDSLTQDGLECIALVGENGSRDNTRKILEAAVTDNFYVLDSSIMSEHPGRLTRMAVGRQFLLEEALRLQLKADYICIADLDNVMKHPPPPSALRAAIERLRSDHGLFAVGATSRPVYYDLFSLKSETYFFPGLPVAFARAKRKPLSYYKFHRETIYAKQREVTSNKPVLCTSSFNGFCLYPWNDYFRGSYRSTFEGAVCEHVTFNCSIAASTGKLMLIAPELVIRTPEDHEPVSFLRFWNDRLRKLYARFSPLRRRKRAT